MSSDWLPVLVVLAVGAIAGLMLARGLVRRQPSKAPGGSKRPRRGADDLRINDLEARRDELYEQLRRSETDADRRQLEDQAARVLRELDELGAARESASRSDAKLEGGGEEAQPSPGRPMLVGFLGGVAMVSLVGVLIYFAVSDARPREGVAGPQPAQTTEEGEHPAADLPPEVQARLDALRQRVAADPSDIVARKQLAMGLLASGQFFEAFQNAGEILNGNPTDPDGLYVQGMVRMTMGQDDMALANLDQVLEQYPNHVLALAGRGMILMRQGDREAAIIVWERALEAAGGSHPDLEQLLAMARDPAHAERMTSAEPPDAGRSRGGDSSATAEVAGDEFAVHVDLAPGVVVPRGAILFVFLREGEGGPPSAVKRIQAPSFPLEVTLGPGDSMMGRPLPREGTITVRLDADGSATTRGEGDLSVDGRGRAGSALRLVLGGS